MGGGHILKTVNQVLTSPFRVIADRFIDEEKNPEMRETVDNFIDVPVAEGDALLMYIDDFAADDGKDDSGSLERSQRY